MKTFTVICILVLSNFAKAEEKEEQLLEAVQAVRLIWTEWMGNAELVYDPINPASIENYHGTWHGEYTQIGETEKVTLVLNKDGSWSDNLWNPGKTARWYLAEGMIVLFEEPDGESFEGLATVLILKNKILHLISNHAKGGLIPLKKQNIKE